MGNSRQPPTYLCERLTTSSDAQHGGERFVPGLGFFMTIRYDISVLSQCCKIPDGMTEAADFIGQVERPFLQSASNVQRMLRTDCGRRHCFSCLAVGTIRKINSMADKISNYLGFEFPRDSVIADRPIHFVPFRYLVVKKITPNHNIRIP